MYYNHLMPLSPSDPLYRRAAQAGQAHIFARWDALSSAEQAALYRQVERLDFALLARASRDLASGGAGVDFSNLEPARAVTLSPEERRQAARLGEQALARGDVAAVVLAGGQGTRLGYPAPKGTFPIGPVTGKSLFAWFSEKIRALQSRFGAPIPWLVMTSPATDAATRLFFEQSGFFGLERKDILFFAQGTLPVLDCRGRLLLDAPGHICESPDGHGGLVAALGASGMLDELARRGVRDLFVWNVDNALVKLPDTAFLGWHTGAEADLSLKCLEKASPEETLGTAVQARGKGEGALRIIEYSDTPEAVARLRDGSGRLVYSTGSINTYLLRLDFLTRLYQQGVFLPCHPTLRIVPALDEEGVLRSPREPNAFKLETKLFDLLLYTHRAGLWMADRAEEFSPLKGSQGPESVEQVRAGLRAVFEGWLRAAGLSLPAAPVAAIEISPRVAADRETFLEWAATHGRERLQAELARQAAETGKISL